MYITYILLQWMSIIKSIKAEKKWRRVLVDLYKCNFICFVALILPRVNNLPIISLAPEPNST